MVLGCPADIRASYRSPSRRFYQSVGFHIPPLAGHGHSDNDAEKTNLSAVHGDFEKCQSFRAERDKLLAGVAADDNLLLL